MAEDMSRYAEDSHYEKVIQHGTESVQLCHFIGPD
jgi:hypothetical protein